MKESSVHSRLFLPWLSLSNFPMPQLLTTAAESGVGEHAGSQSSVTYSWD